MPHAARGVRFGALLALTLAGAGCSVLTTSDTYHLGPYRFQVWYAERTERHQVPAIQIDFRLLRGDEPRADFCRAFAGRMRVIDAAGNVFRVDLHPRKQEPGPLPPVWDGFVGVAVLKTPVVRRISDDARDPLGGFRLVIDNPEPRWYQSEHVVVRLH